jgi:hypothetical protein
MMGFKSKQENTGPWDGRFSDGLKPHSVVWHVLDEENRLVPVSGLKEWAEKITEEKRHVRKTFIGEVEVSTVFLGFDHSWGFGKPEFFETLISAGNHSGWKQRYSSYDQALAGHKKWVEKTKKADPGR